MDSLIFFLPGLMDLSGERFSVELSRTINRSLGKLFSFLIMQLGAEEGNCCKHGMSGAKPGTFPAS